MSTRDPVCGMLIEPAAASASVQEGGETYYFCSATCRDRFRANPAGYTAAAAEAGERGRMERHEPPHTTSGWFTAPKFGSAGSGGLEYESLPEAHEGDPD